LLDIRVFGLDTTEVLFRLIRKHALFV